MVLVSSAVGTLFEHVVVGKILQIDAHLAPHQPYKGVCPESDDKQLTYQYVCRMVLPAMSLLVQQYLV